MKETFFKTNFGPFFWTFFTKRPKNILVKTISCWVLIKKSLTGNLVLCSQILNWIYQKKGPKHLKFGVFSKLSNLGGFSGNRDIQFKI